MKQILNWRWWVLSALLGVGFLMVALMFGEDNLSLIEFIPNPGSLPCVNHKDENKANPKLENLEWCDIQYNTNYGTAPERRARKRGRPVLQFTVDGDLVAEYYSMGVAAKSIGVKSAGNICMCCKGQRPVAYGYVWKYKMDIL